MITFQTNCKDTIEFVRKARVNILRSQTKLAKRCGEVGKARVEANAPVWRGTLRKKVAMKLFPNVHKAEILMASSMYNEIALENEFNFSGRRKL